ncbi:TPA: hypothetical protein QFM36_002735, partial [Enterococcus faecium]
IDTVRDFILYLKLCNRTDQERNVRKYTTINECVINENLCRAPITKHIKNRSKAKDGRTFTTF